MYVEISMQRCTNLVYCYEAASVVCFRNYTGITGCHPHSPTGTHKYKWCQTTRCIYYTVVIATSVYRWVRPSCPPSRYLPVLRSCWVTNYFALSSFSISCAVPHRAYDVHSPVKILRVAFTKSTVTFCHISHSCLKTCISFLVYITRLGHVQRQ